MTEATKLAAAAGSQDPVVGLRAVAALRELLERLEALNVENARSRGWSWQEIANSLGVSRQAVHKKHAAHRLLGEEGVAVFERFTDRARQVVVVSRQEASALGHRFVGTEHLLHALLQGEGGIAATVLGHAGLTDADLREEIARRVGRAGGNPGSDADALRVIGIDIDAIREEVEASFGPGALDRPSRKRRGRRWRRTHCAPAVGDVRFSPRAKKVLELSLREALALGHHHIGTEHILLGMLREGEGLALRILVDRGLALDHLRQQVLRVAGKVA